jgi:hypothetical protein
MSLLLPTGLLPSHVVLDFLDLALAGAALPFLKQVSIHCVLAGGPIRIIMGKPALYVLAPATDSLPLASEFIFVYSPILLSTRTSCPSLCRRSGQHHTPVLPLVRISQVASIKGNACGDGSQAFGHTLRRLIFADERVGAGGECGLLTGVQMADEDDDQRGRAGFPKFFKSHTRRAGE